MKAMFDISLEKTLFGDVGRSKTIEEVIGRGSSYFVAEA